MQNPGEARDRGFCPFNNVAVAARHAVEVRGLKRVAIVDFDVHHGNGTQDIFRDDPRVLLGSSFQYPWYPNVLTPSIDGDLCNVRLPAGTGGRVVSTLEGGYNLDALATSAHSHVERLLDH